MRRYTILILAAFVLTVAAIAGAIFPVGADKKTSGVPLQELTAYTTLPAETVSVLSSAYERENHVKVNFVPMPSGEILQRVKNDAVSDYTKVKTVDLVLTDDTILSEAANLNLFSPYISESGDAVGKAFKDPSDRWVGVWYDPIVFCVNREFMKKIPDVPDTWKELAEMPNVRVGITDFLAADASANLMFRMVGNFGEPATYDILKKLHPKIIQYAKYLSTPARQAGMGEVDVSVAVASESFRYYRDGYPLKIVYPADGTACMLTGVGISSKNPAKNQAAVKFADWLLSDDAQIILRSNGFYFVSTNPQTLAYKTFAGKNIKIFPSRQNFTDKQKQELLDKWVTQVRLK